MGHTQSNDLNSGACAMAAIDWGAIFKRRPDLYPPGYRETLESLLTDPLPVHKATKRGGKAPGRFPSAKHFQR